MLADEADFVIGGDTHRDQHALAVVHAGTGAVEATHTIAADRRGYQTALRFAETHAPGSRVWALEGTGGYGAGLARFLAGHGERVLEVDRPARNDQRTQAKNDQLDAVRAARTLLGRDRHAQPRAGGVREALRALVTTRAGAVDARTKVINQLRALIVSAPDPIRDQLRGLTQARLLERCAHLRPHPAQAADVHATSVALRAGARRIHAVTQEADQLKHEINGYVSEIAPHLLAEPGVGPISAAQVVLAWVTPRPLHNRSALRPTRRRRSNPRLKRTHALLPTRPRRRPPTQPRPAHHHPQPTPAPRTHHRLPPAPPGARHNQPRSRPLPQTLPRPPPLAPTRTHTPMPT